LTTASSWTRTANAIYLTSYNKSDASFFAYDPKRKIGLYFEDLPDATIEALSEKRKAADLEGWRRVLGDHTDGGPP
jgi:hypothetical protein